LYWILNIVSLIVFGHCVIDYLFVQSRPTMVPQRFHGVFSSLLKEQGNVDVAEEERHGEKSPTTAVFPVKAGQTRLSDGQVAVDVYEEEGYLVIKAPIAGVKLSDLDIDIDGNKVTIRGSRKQTDIIDEDRLLIQELHWGDFERTVTLPHAVNPAKVKATFSKDCILKVLIPLSERKVKIIKINEGG
jgi:HSP20 family protein